MGLVSISNIEVWTIRVRRIIFFPDLVLVWLDQFIKFAFLSMWCLAKRNRRQLTKRSTGRRFIYNVRRCFATFPEMFQGICLENKSTAQLLWTILADYRSSIVFDLWNKIKIKLLLNSTVKRWQLVIQFIINFLITQHYKELTVKPVKNSNWFLWSSIGSISFSKVVPVQILQITSAMFAKLL